MGGIMDYKARFYSPCIMQFIQPDTIIPDPSNPQMWNRYSYVGNRPIIMNDPTGHSPIALILVAIALTGLALEWLGVTPEYSGISYAEQIVTDKNAIIGGGIAVQSQWYSGLKDVPQNPLASSYGLAQATTDELKGRDPMDATVAADIMTERIDGAVSLCIRKKLCQDETDNFIVAALAQNGVSPNGWLDVPSLPQSPDGSVDWDVAMTQGGNTGNPVARGRQTLTGMNFSTQFMLNLFTKDVKALIDRGFTLPEQYDEVSWKTIDNLLKVK
jgi:RHS repeat-associated protein